MLPTLASTMLPRLYDDNSRVRAALWSIGSVLPAKTVVETIPATTGSVASMAATLGVRAAAGIGRRAHSCPTPDEPKCPWVGRTDAEP